MYQLESQGTWFAQDGWATCLAVDIGLAPVVPAP
ncbi:phage collar protein [Escherichia coli]